MKISLVRYKISKNVNSKFMSNVECSVLCPSQRSVNETLFRNGKIICYSSFYEIGDFLESRSLCEDPVHQNECLINIEVIIADTVR
jgi:hypothetical protein